MFVCLSFCFSRASEYLRCVGFTRAVFEEGETHLSQPWTEAEMRRGERSVPLGHYVSQHVTAASSRHFFFFFFFKRNVSTSGVLSSQLTTEAGSLWPAPRVYLNQEKHVKGSKLRASPLSCLA